MSERKPKAGSESASLYERYKDALRRGHVAALRGRLEPAIDAYGEAASIASDRALPRAAIGGIFVRMGRMPEALDAYDRALELAPRDETSLRGRAEVLRSLRRPVEAAATLDRLAEILDGAGRLPDACDAARRALELAESKERRRYVTSLAVRLRDSAGDEAAEQALAQVLRFLEPAESPAPDEPAAVVPEAAEPIAVPEGEAEADEPEPETTEPESMDVPESESATPEPEAVAVEPEDLAPVPEAAAPEPVPAEPVPAEPDVAAAPEPEAAEPLPDPQAAEPEPEARAQPRLADPIALGAVGEEALYAGDRVAARDGLLAASYGYRRTGRSLAAIDACYLALAVAPADAELHLMLAELYLDSGWRALAVDKLVLLTRLAELDNDPTTRERVCRVARDRLPDEPRLANLCA